MAPSEPGIPKRIRPPSNAGPAGHDAARTRVPFVITTSVFVPTSTSIAGPLDVAGSAASSIPAGSRSAAASAPT